MATTHLPHVTECSVVGCSYNDHTACQAAAVTIGGAAGDAQCATFIPLANLKGGTPTVSTFVGACQRAECSHNTSLECTAASVRVGSDRGASHADCLTYAPSAA